MKKLMIFPVVCAMLLLTACKFDTVSFKNGTRIEPSSNIVKNLSDALYKVSASAKIFYDMGVKEGQ